MINIDNLKDSQYGYLSNDSRHGFFETPYHVGIDHATVWWPTVTHYLEGKKFEGTQYEDVIRRCKTVLQVKRSTRERKILVVVPTHTTYTSHLTYDLEHRKSYGTKRTGCALRGEWPEERNGHLLFALKNKFEQNQYIWRKLLGTHPIQLSSSDQNMTATILMKIRDLQVKKIKPPEIHPGVNSNHCQLIREIIMRLSIYISGMEGWDRVFPGMVDDAIFNMVPREWNKKIFRTNSDDRQGGDHSEMDKYVAETRLLFTKLDSFQQNIDGPSVKIGKFIFWCIRKKQIIALSKNVHKFISNQNIANFATVIPPITLRRVKRWYRSKQPPKIR